MAPPPPKDARNFTPWGLDQEDILNDIIPETQEPNDQDEDEDEEVQEVDARGKKKEGPKKRESWNDEQEVALAQAWIQISECKKFENEQKAEGFWKRVLEHYASQMGGTTRTVHGILPKWKTMNAAMGLYNGIHIQVKRAKGSGCNDLDIQNEAMRLYKKRTKKDFGHMEAWKVVNTHDKWKDQECFADILAAAGITNKAASSSSKRKSTEYDSASNENILPDMNEDPSPPFVSSSKSRKKQTATSSSHDIVADDISAYTHEKRDYLVLKHEKDQLAKDFWATQIDATKSKSRQRNLKFFTDSHAHITDPYQLELILQEKHEIAEKYG
uniref:uncharacterized protein LOC122608868 n=1 Tax=Erigeron canadensis TaxID=72917 RepID=UPI001CB8ED27|nr:uncharacterized protein LOC122608868 [Erigeron canadensis]